MKIKYPPIQAFDTGFICVGSNHHIYYEQSGNPNGVPVVFLHGGPGSSSNNGHREYFNPEKYRIILLDQRGCGKSTYSDRFFDNTTWHLIEDLEKLKKHLQISSWVVFGASWGAFLGLCYAISYPDSVKALILRGSFLGTKAELDWLYCFGASQIHTERWLEFAKPKIEGICKDLVSYYYEKVFSSDETERQTFAQLWACWELTNVAMQIDEALFSHPDFINHSVAIAQMELHYFKNGCFLPHDSWVMDNLLALKNKPLTLVIGRYDLVTPMSSSIAIHKKLKNSKLHILPLSGHSSSDAAMTDALIDATDNLLSVLAF